MFNDPPLHTRIRKLIMGALTRRAIAEMEPGLIALVDKLLDTLEAMDAFRRPERVEMFVLACMADARGRTGHADAPYPQADIFRQAFEAARSVDTAAVARGGGKGAEIGERIRRERIAAIRRLKVT